MKKVLRLLFHPVLLTVLALAALAVLVWWIGPLVKVGEFAPLASELARAIVIGVLVLIVLLRWAIRRWRVRKASQQLTDGLMKAPAAASAPAAAPGSAEQKVLADRFSEAVATLKKMRLAAAGKKPGWRDWLSLSEPPVSSASSFGSTSSSIASACCSSQLRSLAACDTSRQKYYGSVGNETLKMVMRWVHFLPWRRGVRICRSRQPAAPACEVRPGRRARSGSRPRRPEWRTHS